MSESPKVLAIIPARGGSKRIPRKNIKDFCGKPIIAYSIQAAIDSGSFDEIMVSTDDQEISEIAIKYGAKVPFLRNAELASDMAGTAPVLIDVVSKYSSLGRKFDYVCCIYPTAPFISPEIIRKGMELLISQGVEAVLPVVKYSYPPQRCLVIKEQRVKMLYPENYNVRSQDLEPIYHDCGQFYCLRTDSLISQQKLFCNETIPIEVPEILVQDIDNEDDWKIAQMKYSILRMQQERP